MRRTRARSPFTIMVITAAATAFTVTACSSGSRAPQAASGARSSPATAPAAANPSAPAQLALAAYTAMWGDVQAVGVTSNYQDPRLAEHMQGQPLSTFRENLAEEQSKGIVGRGAPVLHPRVLRVGATSVDLADCLDDRAWLEVYATTGKPADAVPGGLRYVTATVTDEGGTWKVTALDVRGEGTCNV
jgi:hypothetical protein